MISLRSVTVFWLVAVTTIAFADPWSAPGPLNTNASTDGSNADYNVKMATDSKGNWVAVWVGRLPAASDDDILVAYSNNDGTTWSAPVALNTNAATDGTAADNYPNVTTDGKGNWVCTWDSVGVPGVSAPLDFEIAVSRSTNNGQTWTAPAVVNSSSATDSGVPDITSWVATDTSGTWVCAWSKTVPATANDRDIWYSVSSNNGQTWGAEARLNSNGIVDTGESLFPRIASDGKGNWVTIWTSTDRLNNTLTAGQRAFSAKSAITPISWSNAIVLTDASADSVSSLATDKAGNWVALYASSSTLGGTKGSDTDVLIQRSTDNGTTWTAPVVLNSNGLSDSGGDTYPFIASDTKGNWLATWSTASQGSGADADIAFARSTGNASSWTTASLLNSNANSDTGGDGQPIVQTNGTGRYLTGWDSGDSLSGTIGTDLDILYSTASYGEISVSRSVANFGTVDSDTPTTAAITVDLSNIYSGTLNFTGAGLSITGPNASEFQLVSPTTTTLAAFTTRTLTINFNAQSLGAKSAVLHILTDDLDEPDSTVSLQAAVVDQEIFVNITPLNFGSLDVDLGSSGPIVISVSNIGTAPLNLSGISISGPNAADFGFSPPPSTSPVAPGTTRSVSVVFDPATTGAKSATLVINSDDTDEATVQVGLSGNAIDQEISVSPLDLQFGVINLGTGPSAPQSVQISNVGSGPLTFTGAAFSFGGGAAADFSIYGTPSVTPLQPGQSRNVSVRFTPSAIGVRNAVLNITTDDTDEPVSSVTLSGTGPAVPTAAADWQFYD